MLDKNAKLEIHFKLKKRQNDTFGPHIGNNPLHFVLPF